MSFFIACVKKDIRLFFSNYVGAALSLLFPVAVFALLLSGGKELMQASVSVEPFSIAVRDDDRTFMSRVLAEQLQTVGLFDRVIEADAEPDAALFADGVAAVITVPKDFFYLAYDMQSVIGLSLNADMPLESSIVRELAVSILDVVSQNQIAAQVNAALSGQDMSDAVKAEAARAIFRDAFAMLDLMQMNTAADAAMDSMTTMLLSCVLSLFLMLIPLQVAVTLCEDLSAGILPRYTAAGGSAAAVCLSKFFTALVLTGLPVLLVLLGLRPAHPGALLAVCAVLFLAAFGVFFLAATVSRRSERVLLFGNLYILVSILLGGVVYPVALLPDAVAGLRYLMLPYYTLSGVMGVSLYASVPIRALLPALIVGAAGMLIGVLFFGGRRART